MAKIPGLLAVLTIFLLADLSLAGAQETPPVLKSMMFSPSEIAKIRQAQADFERLARTGGKYEGPPVENRPNAVPNIALSGLMNYGDGRWTVWVNGFQISPDHQVPAFTILSVSDSSVEFSVAGSQPARFRLRPYQTWRSAHQDIVEGIVP